MKTEPLKTFFRNENLLKEKSYNTVEKPENTLLKPINQNNLLCLIGLWSRSDGGSRMV